jgi:hypothetical protein
MHKSIRPQRLFGKLNAKQPEKTYGRIGRWYLSKEMADVKEWCERNGLSFSFDYFHEKGRPFLEDNMLGVIGEVTDETMSDFPVPFDRVEVLR